MNVASLKQLNPMPTLISAGIVLTAVGAIYTAATTPLNQVQPSETSISSGLERDTVEISGK